MASARQPAESSASAVRAALRERPVRGPGRPPRPARTRNRANASASGRPSLASARAARRASADARSGSPSSRATRASRYSDIRRRDPLPLLFERPHRLACDDPGLGQQPRGEQQASPDPRGGSRPEPEPTQDLLGPIEVLQRLRDVAPEGVHPAQVLLNEPNRELDAELTIQPECLGHIGLRQGEPEQPSMRLAAIGKHSFEPHHVPGRPKDRCRSLEGLQRPVQAAELKQDGSLLRQGARPVDARGLRGSAVDLPQRRGRSTGHVKHAGQSEAHLDHELGVAGLTAERGRGPEVARRLGRCAADAARRSRERTPPPRRRRARRPDEPGGQSPSPPPRTGPGRPRRPGVHPRPPSALCRSWSGLQNGVSRRSLQPDLHPVYHRRTGRV